MKLKEWLTTKLKLHRMGIRKQILYLVLACSLMTLFVAGGISIFGVFDIKINAVKVGNEIGESAAENSSKALKEVSIKSLQGLANERAYQLKSFFRDYMWDVNLLATEMTTILQNSQNYRSRAINEPRRQDDGKVTAKLQYKAGVNRAALEEEVGLTANLQDFQIRLFDGSPYVGANYVASKNGFNITVDRISANRLDADGNPLPNDYSSRPWYRKAMSEKKLIFTDLFVDAQGRGVAVSCAAPYYGADGEVAGVVGEGMTLKSVNDIVSDTAMGETSTAFIMDNKTGKIIFSSEVGGELGIDHDYDFTDDPSLFDIEELAEVSKKMAAGETGLALVKVDGINHYVAYTQIENVGWSFGVALEEQEVTLPAKVNEQLIENTTENFVGVLNNSIKLMIIAMLVAFAVIIALVPFIGKKIADAFIKPLNILTDGVREIASGNLDKKIEVDTDNEIKHLAVCFNAMTDELKKYMTNLTKITAEKERIATELNVATEIQKSLLPQDFNFDRKDFDIYATMTPAKEVGGDFYDFYLLDENHLVITIADVSGKGIPAALFMMMSKTILKNFAMTMQNPDDFAAVMTLTNDQLCQNNDAMMFVTVFFGMLDLKTGEFTFVNGGHNPPLVYHSAEDKFEYLKVQKNFVLGGMDGLNFAQQKIQLGHGDLIYLYTDGVTEALNPTNELYGEKRLLDCLNRSDKKISVVDLLKFVREDVNKHVNGAAQSDDITMIALKFH